MLTHSAIASASGAASYFAQDNYFTAGELEEHSAWGGRGAEELGLSGSVTAADFEKLLSGDLPDGEHVGADGTRHRPGFDLTFSAPKSVSLMALVADDKRISVVHRAAVEKTLAWAERNLVQTRQTVNGRQQKVAGDKLVYALFEHDVSRNLDPQLHIHAIIMNMTQRPDGKCGALVNDAIFKNNAVLGSIYHANLRTGLEKIGYRTELDGGKHGTFRIAGVSREVEMLASSRRAEILEIAAKVGAKSPEALEAIAVRSRPAKEMTPTAALRGEWAARYAEHGIDLANVRDAAMRRRPEPGLLTRIRAFGETVMATFTAHLRNDYDPLLSDRQSLRRAEGLAAAYAVASGVRHLSERDAVFDKYALIKSSLDFGHTGANVDSVEARIASLEQQGELIRGVPGHDDKFTTREMLDLERLIVAKGISSIGQVNALVDPKLATDSLQAAAQSSEHELNEGQLIAATGIVAGSDRVMAIQGIAGAGKSSMIAAAARVLERSGHKVIGLAAQNKMVADLRSGAAIPASTIHTFMRDADRPGAARHLRGSILIVDESSMLSNRQMAALMMTSERVGVAKLVLIGDHRQLPSPQSGRPFGLAMEQGLAPSLMPDNLRQRDPELRAVVALAQNGLARAALDALGERVRESDHPAKAAAKQWLALDKSARKTTSLFASGHANRWAIIDHVRAALIEEGSLGKDVMTLTVLEPVNLTREALRHPHNYAPGLVLEMHKPLPRQGLERGSYRIAGVDQARGRVTLSDGRRYHHLQPSKLSPRFEGLSLSERRDIEIRKGDDLRWTSTDTERGLIKSERADVIALHPTGVDLKLASGDVVTLAKDDPMLARLTHGAALNMHMAQGMTAENAIGAMDSRERHLSNQSLFYVMVSRSRDDLTLHVDNREQLGQRLEANDGQKLAAHDIMAAPEWTDGKDKFDPFTGEIDRKDFAPSMDLSSGKSRDARSLLGMEPEIVREVTREPPELSRDFDFSI